MKERMLVVAPHPDDEVLGAGGALARAAAAGAETFVVIVTRGYPPAFCADLIAQGRREAAEAHRLLGVHETIELDFPAAAVDSVPHRDLNAALDEVMREVRPARLFIPFMGDVHLDHQRISHSALVASRPSASWTPQAVYAYETLSETNWNAPYLCPGFHPNVYLDISQHLETKIRAMQSYVSQVKPFPHERSIEALRALALLRGSTVGQTAAEAFVLVRQAL
jgi:LmbE family N-acetylglucosaminyl deacetylase